MSDRARENDLGRISRRPYRRPGLDRQTRLTITVSVVAALILGLGVGLGFAIGRATAPEPEQPPVAQAEATLPVGVVEEVPTETDEELAADPTSEEEAQGSSAADVSAPPTPRQVAPGDGAVIDASRVDLRWSEVEDDSAEPVTYAFEIQDRASSGSYGKTQVISDLKDPTYSARVLSVRRRWRVWSVDAAGNASEKSEWRSYIQKAKPKASTPERSDETT